MYCKGSATICTCNSCVIFFAPSRRPCFRKWSLKSKREVQGFEVHFVLLNWASRTIFHIRSRWKGLWRPSVDVRVHQPAKYIHIQIFHPYHLEYGRLSTDIRFLFISSSCSRTKHPCLLRIDYRLRKSLKTALRGAIVKWWRLRFRTRTLLNLSIFKLIFNQHLFCVFPFENYAVDIGLHEDEVFHAYKTEIFLPFTSSLKQFWRFCAYTISPAAGPHVVTKPLSTSTPEQSIFLAFSDSSREQLAEVVANLTWSSCDPFKWSIMKIAWLGKRPSRRQALEIFSYCDWKRSRQANL